MPPNPYEALADETASGTHLLLPSASLLFLAATMEVFVNGEPRQMPAGSTIATLLGELKLDTRFVAVECNLELIPRAEHAAHLLQAGDRLEVVTLVGGG